MASGDNGWFTLMQSRPARIAMNGLCAAICAFYAVDAAVELLTPGRSANLVAMVGTTAYYVMTVLRLVVLVWAAIAFGRIAYKAVVEHDDTDDECE